MLDREWGTGTTYLSSIFASAEGFRTREFDDREPFLLRNTLFQRREWSGEGREGGWPSSGVLTLNEVELEAEEFDGRDSWTGRNFKLDTARGGGLGATPVSLRCCLSSLRPKRDATRRRMFSNENGTERQAAQTEDK